MINEGDGARDLSSLRVLRCGALEGTGDPFGPYQVVDVDGVVVAPVTAYLRDLQACGRPAATQRSYAMDLLRWFRFLWAVDVGWDQATRVEARDFCRWIQLAAKPGGPSPDARYAPATVAHCETVLRGFYDFHLEAGTGPIVNPFPLARSRRGRANAHHNPMEPFRTERTGRYRPKIPRRIPRQIPDEKFDELFAVLGSHRDRALVAFWVSTGARAAELLGARRADADPGQQLITVIRKGTRALQPLPASPDAFVWLRLYQQQMHGLVPAGPDDPLWWTLRRPFRPLSYYAARAMFTRAGAALGGRWRLHDLRHTAAYRMARDPAMPLTDVQWVLGHAHLSTTQLYTTAPEEDVIAAVVAHHARRRERPPAGQDGAGASSGYRPESLSVLFGGAEVSGPGQLGGPAAVTGSAGMPVYQGSRPLRADPAPSAALLRRFPPRLVPASWVLTSQPKPQALARLLVPPFPTGRRNLDQERRRGLGRVLDWLETQPGDTWQDRWITSGADAAGPATLSMSRCWLGGRSCC